MPTKSLCCLSILLLASQLVGQEDAYDLVLRNGRVVDGSGNPWFIGDVAIRGDRIVSAGRVKPFPATREIDATGLVIAPGFIDMHSHSDLLLLEDGNASSKIHQGVTTEILGEGSSAGPYEGKLSPQQTKVGDTVAQWSTLGEYFDLIDRSGVATNVASYVGLNNAWQSVMGESFDHPTGEQIQAMREIVDRAMRDGAFGLSSQVMMPPGSLATTDDIVEIAKAIVPYRGIYSTHIRNEGTGVFESVKEAIEIGLHQRGLLASGFFADVTVFDSQTVIDRATYTDPFQYNEGVQYVIVNGAIVLDDGKHTGSHPGRALRATNSRR